MKNEPVRVLLIEDDEDDVMLTKTYLAEVENSNFLLSWESDLVQARARMVESDFDVFLIDYRLGSETGLELIKYIQSKGVLTPAILLTGQGDLTVDLDATRYGAADYLVKSDLSPSSLDRSIRYAISQSKIIQELDEKEKKYRSLFERSVDPVFLLSEDLHIQDVNESFLKIFGTSKTKNEVFSLESLFVRHSDYIYFAGSLMHDRFICDFETQLNTDSGIPKTCLLNAVFIPHQPQKFCSYQCVVHDLTKRKQAENEMLMAERLSLTGVIARTLAHEIRNPLTNLNLALSHLRAEFPTDNVSVKLYEDIIERNASRIESLISEMLNSSRPDRLELELCQIVEVIHSALFLAQDRIKLRKTTISLSCTDHMSRVLVDKKKMTIAILNIIINAIEATRLNQGIITITGIEENDTITISIADNGCGILPADLTHLFDPFFTTKKIGMGLGLTSTRNILNSHSVRLNVESSIQKGTTFSLNFKLAV